MSNVVNFQAYKNTATARVETFEEILLQLERVVFAMQLKRDKAYEVLSHVMDYCRRKKVSITEAHIQNHLQKILSDIKLDVIDEDSTQIITIDMLLEAFQLLDDTILSHQTAISKAQKYFFKKNWLSNGC